VKKARSPLPSHPSGSHRIIAAVKFRSVPHLLHYWTPSHVFRTVALARFLHMLIADAVNGLIRTVHYVYAFFGLTRKTLST